MSACTAGPLCWWHQGCPPRSRCRTESKYIINAQLPFVARGSVSWLEVVGTLGVWVFAELRFWGGGGRDVPSVVAPGFRCALSSSFRSFLLEGWSGLMVISKFTCKAEPGFSHLANTPRSWPRGCIQPMTERFPDLLWESWSVRPSQGQEAPCLWGFWLRKQGSMLKAPCSAVPSARLPSGTCLSSRGRSLG